jgi:hypothetical protein
MRTMIRCSSLFASLFPFFTFACILVLDNIETVNLLTFGYVVLYMFVLFYSIRSEK